MLFSSHTIGSLSSLIWHLVREVFLSRSHVVRYEWVLV